MIQYCRYCSHMICGDANYCSKKVRTYSTETIKRPNQCKDFELNPVDALGENPKGYKPREPVEIPDVIKNQISIFDEEEK